MPQLTMKDLDRALRALEFRVQIIENEDDGPTVESDSVPQWGLDMVEALIEALHGVRLQGAQQYAIKLQAKYFSEEPELQTQEQVVRTVNEDKTLWG